MTKNRLLTLLFSLFTVGLLSAQTWSGLGAGIGYHQSSGLVIALTTYNGDLYAGGGFDAAGGVAAHNIAKWDGSSWSALGAGIPDSNFRYTVEAMCSYNNNLYAAGTFDSAGGLKVHNIAFWDGNNWADVGGGVNGTIHALCVYNGELYVGGIFSNAGGIPVHNLAKWSGSSWADVGQGVNQGVFAMTVNSDNLYVGGNVDSAGAIAARGIAMWNGTTWSGLTSGITGCDALYSDGSALYVGGGNFDSAGSIEAFNVAKWTGNQWSALGNGVPGVYCLTGYNNRIYAGGPFSQQVTGIANNVVVWNGTDWLGLGEGTNDWVDAMCIWNGNLYVGGTFDSAGSVKAYGIAKWDIPATSGLNDIKADNYISIYPNPSNSGVVIVTTDFNSPIIITDLLGQTVIKDSALANTKTTIDVSHLAKGVYFINGNKFVKE